MQLPGHVCRCAKASGCKADIPPSLRTGRGVAHAGAEEGCRGKYAPSAKVHTELFWVHPLYQPLLVVARYDY